MTTKPMRIHGVDISHHQQQKIHWGELRKAGVQWMYHKSTEGSTWKDQNYSRRRTEAAAANMPFGAYHFARPNGGEKDAREEARFFIRVADPKPGDLRPCLDLEVQGNLTNNEIDDWADAFCDEVQKLTDVFPVVYTPYHLSASLERKALFWVPRYNNQNRPPERSWDIWQFSNGVYGKPNSVKGLGKVDLNHSKVHLEDLRIPKAAKKNLTRGHNIDNALDELGQANKVAKRKDKKSRGNKIRRAMKILRRLPKWNKK